MKFFNIDLHISVIEDLKFIFKNMGHEVIDWSISGHAHVFSKKIINNGIVGQDNWNNIDFSFGESFYKKYKEELKSFDAFICTYPPAFSYLYSCFEKPIIVVSPIRYETPFYSHADKWRRFNQYLIDNIDSGKVIPIANSRYDAEYAKLFTKREWQHIPSLCEYCNVYYNPVGKKKHALLKQCNINLEGNDIVYLNYNYDWNHLAEFSSAIFFPYNASIMKIFEWYGINTPLFFPSQDFLEKMKFDMGINIMNHLSFNEIYSLPSKSVLGCDFEYDPNNYRSRESFKHWIKYSDFYDENNMPFIVFFSSFEELRDLLQSVDLDEISQNMNSFNLIKRKNVYKRWENVLNRLK